jgi:hypothetical protein
MARLRYNGVSATLAASATSSATTLTLDIALTHSAGTAVPSVGGGDVLPLSLIDATGKLTEIVHVTAYTAGATTVTVTRGREGTSGVSHVVGERVMHGPTAADFGVPVGTSAPSAATPGPLYIQTQ